MSWINRLLAWLSSEQFDDDVHKVQVAVVRSCRFLPTAATVANIFAAGNPAVVTTTAVAAAICAAVDSKRLSFVNMGRIYAPMRVGKVLVEGEFV